MSYKFIYRLLPSINRTLLSARTYNSAACICTRNVCFSPQVYSRPAGSASQPSEGEEVSVKDASKDRTKPIPVETSVRYLQSSAYAATYGEHPVWKLYKRNHKGAIPPRKTRKTCIRSGQICTGNPCPLCRDEYLVLHPENPELLKQFISPHTGEILNYSVTGVCQRKYKELLVAIAVARDQGLITYDVPFRSYNYSLYKPKS